jgi:hypothetical protein
MKIRLQTSTRRRRATAIDFSHQRIDVQLTPATTDGRAWTARMLSARAKAVFLADEVLVAGTVVPWLMPEAARAHLLVD